MHDFSPEMTKNVYKLLEKLDKSLSEGKSFNMILNKETEEIKENTINLLSNIEEVSPFLFEDHIKKKSNNEINEIVRNGASRLTKFIQKQRDQLSIRKILRNERDFGAVMISTELCRSLYFLGEYMLNKEEGKYNEDEFEIHAKTILIESANWVKYIKNKWGTPPDFDVVAVSPISKTEEIPF